MHELTEHKYWIAYNNEGVVHYGENVPPAITQTGQPFFETFDDEEAWGVRLRQLGVESAGNDSESETTSQ